MKKLVRITTVPLSLEKLLEGQLNFMQKEYEVIAVSANAERLNRFGKETGVRTFPVEMTREITPRKDLNSVYNLYKFLKREKPLIVHTHTPKAGIAGMMAAKLAGVPLRLHTVAGLPLLEAKGPKKKLLEIVEKVTFSCATNVYPNSARIHEYLVEKKFAPKEKLKVIGKGSSNGIDTSYFDPSQYPDEQVESFRSSLKIPRNDLVFIFIGRLVGDKGINELVEAFKGLNQKHEQISLLLVGPLEEDLDPLKRETTETIKKHPKIFDVGFQNDVRPFLACADVLTFPSYREGFPNVVMQAGAMGLPSIVTNINGCNEIIQEGVNGTIIPVRSVERLYDAMNSMIEQKGYRENLKKQSREIIVQNYGRLEIWEALLSEYRRLERELKFSPA